MEGHRGGGSVDGGRCGRIQGLGGEGNQRRVPESKLQGACEHQIQIGRVSEDSPQHLRRVILRGSHLMKRAATQKNVTLSAGEGSVGGGGEDEHGAHWTLSAVPRDSDARLWHRAC